MNQYESELFKTLEEAKSDHKKRANAYYEKLAKEGNTILMKGSPSLKNLNIWKPKRNTSSRLFGFPQRIMVSLSTQP